MAPQFNSRAAKGTTDTLFATPVAMGCVSPSAADLFGSFGHLPLCTSRVEHTEVATRGIGEATDTVSAPLALSPALLSRTQQT